MPIVRPWQSVDSPLTNKGKFPAHRPTKTKSDFLSLIIIRGGENIAARNVEDLISSHPKVEYVAVVGMPDPDLGEQVCVYIKGVEGASIGEENILEYLKEMEAPKILYPGRIEFVDEIPLIAVGKADKKVLKKDTEEKGKRGL